MIFSNDEIVSLIREDALPRFPPPKNEAVLADFFRATVAKIRAGTGTMDRTEWTHYGSGYASFVDAWFYHPDGRARRSTNQEHHAGLFVLLSRLTRFYALGQADKAWHAKGGSSYMPALGLIDAIEHPALQPTADQIESILNESGLQRICRADLEPLIAPELAVPTLLSDRPFRVFDALFYWMD